MSAWSDDETFLRKVGQQIQKERKNNSLTQKQLAPQLGLSVITLSQIERGVAGTTLKTLFKIAKKLNVSPAQLILNSDEILFLKSDIAKLYLRVNK